MFLASLEVSDDGLTLRLQGSIITQRPFPAVHVGRECDNDKLTNVCHGQTRDGGCMQCRDRSCQTVLKKLYDGARVPASLHIMNWAGNAERALVAGHIGKVALERG